MFYLPWLWLSRLHMYGANTHTHISHLCIVNVYTNIARRLYTLGNCEYCRRHAFRIRYITISAHVYVHCHQYKISRERCAVYIALYVNIIVQFIVLWVYWWICVYVAIKYAHSHTHKRILSHTHTLYPMQCNAYEFQIARNTELECICCLLSIQSVVVFGLPRFVRCFGFGCSIMYATISLPFGITKKKHIHNE